MGSSTFSPQIHERLSKTSRAVISLGKVIGLGLGLVVIVRRKSAKGLLRSKNSPIFRSSLLLSPSCSLFLVLSEFEALPAWCFALEARWMSLLGCTPTGW